MYNLTAFTLQQQLSSWDSMCGPHNLKSLLSDPLQKIIAYPDVKEGISNILEGKQKKKKADLKTKRLSDTCCRMDEP